MTNHTPLPWMLAKAEGQSTQKPVAWLHEITEPDGQSNSLLSRSADNPWSHWLESHRDKCQYKVTPLYNEPLDHHPIGLLIAEDTVDGTGQVIAELDKHENAERDGEFIIRACNSHETLVVALESIAKLRIIGDMNSEHVQQLVWMQDLAKAALANVEEGASRA